MDVAELPLAPLVPLEYGFVPAVDCADALGLTLEV